MNNKFNGLVVDNLTAEELSKLWGMKRKRKKNQYKIIITTDRNDVDLTSLADNPSLGIKIGTFYFSYPRELRLIVKAFEGHFYETTNLETGEIIGYGVVEPPIVYEDWWDAPCEGVCEYCFKSIDRGVKDSHGNSLLSCREKKYSLTPLMLKAAYRYCDLIPGSDATCRVLIEMLDNMDNIIDGNDICDEEVQNYANRIYI